MTIAIVIGCYRLTAFIELGIIRWRRLFPDVPILLSDDRSPESPTIQKLAEKHGCDYTCPERRRSHFSGDMQSVLNGIVFAKEVDAEIVIKSSQRFIPVLPGFHTALERALADEQCLVCLPGQLSREQIVRPTSRFYSKFGILTDVLAVRTKAIKPEQLLEVYRDRCRDADARKRPVSDSFAETTWGWLLEHRFPTPKHRILPEWTHHEQGKPKLYLRKSQSPASDYAQIAMMEGIRADWDLREWIQIEGKHGYKPKADIV